jgi:hypothetical protein
MPEKGECRQCKADVLVKSFLATHGRDPAVVPKWHGDDFDSIYVVKITLNDGKTSFIHMQENLNDQPTSCP